MSLEWSGLVLAITTFATIGIGHVFVRRLHPKFGTRLGIPFMLLGIAVLIGSLFVTSNLIAGVLGIVAITFIWDGIEFYRQEKRVQQGRNESRYTTIRA